MDENVLFRSPYPIEEISLGLLLLLKISLGGMFVVVVVVSGCMYIFFCSPYLLAAISSDFTCGTGWLVAVICRLV